MDIAEKRLRQKIDVSIKSSKINKKTRNKQEKNKQDCGKKNNPEHNIQVFCENCKGVHMYDGNTRREERKEWKKYLKLWLGISPKLMSDTNAKVQKTQRTPSSKNK